MADSNDNRKKALIISVLLFLAAGGGIFVFFIIQGANDLTGAGKNAGFSYGFAVREAVLPLFKRMGFDTYDDEVAQATKKRLEVRGFDLDGDSQAASAGDVSDWMQKPAASPAPAATSRPVTPTSVPKMSGALASSVGGLGGGGSKSSGGLSRFGDGAGAGAGDIKGKSAGGAAGAPDKGTLGALKNAKAVLGEGLRSGSAMTASAKWNQSFGVGSGSNRGGDLSYGKTGLVNLDKIKSGEIADLKMDKMGGLKTTDVGNPLKDVAGTKAALDGDKKFKEDMESKMKQDMANEAISAAGNALASGAGGGKPGEEGGDGKSAQQDPNKPPQNIIDMAIKPQDAGGKACASGCDLGGSGVATDKTINYEPSGTCPGCWNITYNGTQTMPDGSVIQYQDTMTVNPATGEYIPVGSVAGPAGGQMKPVGFGGVN